MSDRFDCDDELAGPYDRRVPVPTADVVPWSRRKSIGTAGESWGTQEGFYCFEAAKASMASIGSDEDACWRSHTRRRRGDRMQHLDAPQTTADVEVEGLGRA